MFGRKKKSSFELVKFSHNDKYRVTMLKGLDGYIVFDENIENKTIGVGGVTGVPYDEADCTYNKMCYQLGIGENE